jgi:hypothetical protein
MRISFACKSPREAKPWKMGAKSPDGERILAHCDFGQNHRFLRGNHQTKERILEDF